MTRRPNCPTRRIVPPGVVVRLPSESTFSAFCSCSLNIAALFPDGLPSPPLPLSRCELHELLLALPQRLQNSPWRVCYDTEHDGFSLHNFYRKMKQVHDEKELGIGIFVVSEGVSDLVPISSVGGLLGPQSRSGVSALPSSVVLGCFTPEVPCLEHSQHAFFGAQETFVFTYADVSRYASEGSCGEPQHASGVTPAHSSSAASDVIASPKMARNFSTPSLQPSTRLGFNRLPRILSVYPWTLEEKNKEFLVCTNKFFGIGGGRDGAAIFVDASLSHGTSSVFCGTFASPPLGGRLRATLRQSEFTVLRMVWFRVRDRKEVFTCMDLPKRELCDCGRLLESEDGNRLVRVRYSGHKRAWHICN